MKESSTRQSIMMILVLQLIVLMAVLARNTKSLNIEHLDGTTILIVALQLFYIMHGSIHEAALLTSFEIMYEGTGYMMCVNRLLYPFLMTIATRFTLYQE